MKEIKQKPGETRKDYLIRVAIHMLKSNGYRINEVIYDGAECDAFWLAMDLETELEDPEIKFSSEVGTCLSCGTRWHSYETDVIQDIVKHIAENPGHAVQWNANAQRIIKGDPQ